MPSGTFSAKAIIGYKGGIRHRFNSGVNDGADATKIRPTDWHADHDNPAVYDFSLANTPQALSADGTVITRTLTLKAGTYRVIAFVRTSTSSGSPGAVYLRKDSSRILDGTWADLRSNAAMITLFGVFAHTGGSVTVDVFYAHETGTMQFGINGTSEERFGQKLLIERIGD